MRNRDDLGDVIREDRSRGRKRPIDIDAVKKQESRRLAVLKILKSGTREDMQALLKSWGYSKAEIESALREFDAARGQESF